MINQEFVVREQRYVEKGNRTVLSLGLPGAKEGDCLIAVPAEEAPRCGAKVRVTVEVVTDDKIEEA